MSAPTYDLGKLHGGLRLPAHKQMSTSSPIVEVPVPGQIVLPLTQHAGNPAQPVVSTGERVLKGQLIAQTEGSLGAPIHASSSGTVVAIEPWPVPRRYGDDAPCIIIECDGEDLAVEADATETSFDKLPADELLTRILAGGIVGLGGAVFPTAQKLMQATTGKLEYLILNGVECEPYISCDDMLMREYARETLLGAQILLHALGLDTGYIVVESDKPDALKRLGEALADLGDDRLILKQVPTIYPSGGEDQLVQLVTNREVPSGGLPTDVGCLVQNVGTAAAIHDWIMRGATGHDGCRHRRLHRRLYRACAPADHRWTYDRQVGYHGPGTARQSRQLHPRNVRSTGRRPGDALHSLRRLRRSVPGPVIAAAAVLVCLCR